MNSSQLADSVVSLGQSEIKNDLPPERDDADKSSLTTEASDGTHTPTLPVTRSRLLTVNMIKVEDVIQGKIQCPKCSFGIVVSDKGCNIITCRNHRPQFFYFCIHCKQECQDSIARCNCSRRNTPETREHAQQVRNAAAAGSPIIIDDNGSDDIVDRELDDNNEELTRIAASAATQVVDIDKNEYKGAKPSANTGEVNEEVEEAADIRNEDSSMMQDVNSVNNLRGNKLTKAAPTSVVFDHDDENEEKEHALDVNKNDSGDIQTAAALTITESQYKTLIEKLHEEQHRKKKRKKRKAPEKDPAVEAKEEVKALQTIRSWLKDYEDNHLSGRWSNPDPEFSHYSSRPDETPDFLPPFLATKLVQSLQEHLCRRCGNSLATYLTVFSQEEKLCYSCYQKRSLDYEKYTLMPYSSKNLLSPTKASRLFRFDKDGRHILMYETDADTSKPGAGIVSTLNTYHPFKCLNAAVRVHGGFFSAHLVMAKLKEPDYVARAREARERRRYG